MEVTAKVIEVKGLGQLAKMDPSVIKGKIVSIARASINHQRNI
jgi:hypothetical protein